MATSTQPMSFAEFEKLPRPEDGWFELRHGELIKVTRPIYQHSRVQEALHSLLKQAAGDRGFVFVELGFRPVPEGEFRVSDVAYVSHESDARQNRKGSFRGTPDIVIEILSPSNTAAEIRDKKKLCLENGAREFWVVDIDLREVEVSTPDGRSITYQSTHEIPLFFGGTIPANSIFSI